MNEIDREDRKFSRHAPEIQTAASEWVVERQMSANWNADDQRALDAWLAQSILHRVAYVRFDDAWRRSHRLAALKGPNRRQAAMTALVKMRPLLFRSAAVAICAAVIGLSAVLLRPAAVVQTFATSIGGRETVVLADGSQIELNTNTALRVNETAERRTVWLDRGEAFFQMKHDPRRPLTVYAGMRRVIDLGTEFVIRREADRLKVALLEGRVVVGSNEAGDKDVVLEPGNVLLATVNQVSVTKAPPRALANELSWRLGLLVFHRTSLKDAAMEFNRYNHEEITIADPAIGQLIINGSLPANNPEELAQIAHSFFGLNFAKTNGKIVIYRERPPTR